MLAEERRRRIMQLVEARGSTSVKELSNSFGVTPMTIRRDLEALASEGLVIKTRGGAITRNYHTGTEVPYAAKMRAHLEEKIRIGRMAASFIRSGETVIIDSGSTAIEVARGLSDQAGLTVVTNDLKIAMELANRPDTTVVDTGGIVQKSVYTLVGPQTLAFLSGLHVDKTFLGADAVDQIVGLTNRTLQEVPIKQAMINAAKEVFLVADSSKFGQMVFAAIAPISSVHHIVTDDGLPEDTAKALVELGISLHLA